MAVLKLKNVKKIFAGEPPVVAVDDVTFELPEKAFAALIGPSGSGKTTLLNLAAGLDHPTSGNVFIGETSIASLSSTELCIFRQRHVGFIFQSYNLFPVLSAVENVEFTCLIRGDRPADARNKAIEALKKVGLSEKLEARPHQLSGGQQQRVAVARALATRPDIIFADEPTANLDSKTAHNLIELFEALNSEMGVSFLFSTHDTRLVDRTQLKLEMHDGKLK